MALRFPSNPTAQELARALERLGDVAFADVLERTIGTVETPVAHGLNRVPQGWAPVSPADGAAVPAETTTPRDSRYLYLIASSAVTCKLLVW